MTHICVRKLTIIGSDNGLSPGRRQAIIWTDAGLLLIGTLGTNSSEILVEIYIFPLIKKSFGNVIRTFFGQLQCVKCRSRACIYIYVINIKSREISVVRHCSRRKAALKGLKWWSCRGITPFQYCDVIMGAMASQITSLTIVYSTVYSNVDQRKRQRSASLDFVRGIHRWPVNSPHKWLVTRKMCPFDDVIMISFFSYTDIMTMADKCPEQNFSWLIMSRALKKSTASFSTGVGKGLIYVTTTTIFG